jgi:3-phosphoshikimate 1-carboxyvinyltransferase
MTRTALPNEVTVGGGRPLRGRLRVPGDKSISHRAYLFAALTEGPCRLANLATGDDVHATRLALEHLGVKIRRGPAGTTVVHGTTSAGWREPENVLDCANSGTTMRVLAGALAAMPFLSVLTGDASLRRRPMARVVEPLRAMGARVDGRDGGRLAPLVIQGEPLRGMRHELSVASAQVKSALVLAALHADGPSEVVSPAQSRDHTERMLAALGAPVTTDGLTVQVEPGAPGSFDLDVPGDPSSAAFFAVAATIVPGSDLVLEDVSLNPTRLGFVEVLRRMGADLTIEPAGTRAGEPVGSVRVRSAELVATTMAGDEIANIIDEIPALAVAAAFADGITDIRDAEELAVKETNRIGALHQELTELGVAVEARADGLTIRGGPLRPALLKSHGDHRIALAAAVAGHALPGTSTVRGWRAAAVSYPEFAEHLAAVTSS